MRLIVFLFLAAFLVSGLVRYSRAAAPPPVPAQAAGQGVADVARPIAAPVLPQPGPMAGAAAQAQPEPHVLKHKRRYARAALAVVQKMREPPLPPRRMAKLIKPARSGARR